MRVERVRAEQSAVGVEVRVIEQVEASQPAMVASANGT